MTETLHQHYTLYSANLAPGFWQVNHQSEPFPTTKSILVNCWAEIRVMVEADEIDGEWSFEPISTENSAHWPELHCGYCSCLEHSRDHRCLFFFFCKAVACICTFSSPKLSDISPKFSKVKCRTSSNPLIPENALSLDKISPFSGSKYEGKLWN